MLAMPVTEVPLPFCRQGQSDWTEAGESGKEFPFSAQQEPYKSESAQVPCTENFWDRQGLKRRERTICALEVIRTTVGIFQVTFLILKHLRV